MPPRSSGGWRCACVWAPWLAVLCPGLVGAAAAAEGQGWMPPAVRGAPRRAAGGFSPQQRGGAWRRLEQAAQAQAGKSCNAVALRLMPPPALKSYQLCFEDKMLPNSSHDWSVPGAELAAQTDCWCQNNLTATIKEYECCDHADLFPMCTLECNPDCKSALATQCIEECPSMCFEATEYVIDKGLCSGCDWEKCWPVMKCMTMHAEKRIEAGTLDRTCHESGFTAGEPLMKYWKCWHDSPKHSSHWNSLSSVVNCMCREGMIEHTRANSCCESQIYGGGVCELECLSEADCNGQEAQTCIHTCQERCPAFEITANQDCLRHCLVREAPCRKYVSCRPPTVSTHVCDDGRWPEAASGCCALNSTSGSGVRMGCPKLCGSQHVWRLDGGRSIPWWSRWNPSPGIVAQCSCQDCPGSVETRTSKLYQTVEDNVWENGQLMLIDIARREGLLFGPNRQMQELMVARNREILQLLQAKKGKNDLASEDGVASINNRYAQSITEAARTFGDDASYYYDEQRNADSSQRSYTVFGTIAGVCTVAIICAIAVATKIAIHRRKFTPVLEFGSNQQVVVGNPVPPADAEVPTVTGAPVTVSAPMKTSTALARQPSWQGALDVT